MSSSSSTYDEYASNYAQWMTTQEQAGVQPGSNIARFLQVIGDVAGLTVLDAGCGEGYLSRLLRQRGAHVTGIDISPRLIELARAKDPTGTITYQVADLSQPLPAYQEHFDLIASFFVLNDVADYRGFLSTLASVLKRAGRLVLFLNNPYSLVLRGHITDYFAVSGQAVPYRGLAQAGIPVYLYHRTLEDYLAASLSVGLQLQRLVDVSTPPGSVTRHDDMLLPEGYHFPFFLILSFVKG